MSAYIDSDEKFVARIGGTYSPGVEKAEQSLELTDRRIYYSATSRVGDKQQTVQTASSVIDASDVSAVTFGAEKPRGSFGLGILFLIVSLIVGIVIGVVGYLGENGGDIVSVVIPVCVGLGVGVVLLVGWYVLTLFLNKSKRAVTVSIEYRGLILSVVFHGVPDGKLEEFRQWTFRVKDRMFGRPVTLPSSEGTPYEEEKPPKRPLYEQNSPSGGNEESF